MKNTNITLHTTQKKEYVLTGILSLPLHLGERAWIYSYNQTFATSPVQSILEVSENGVVFETWRKESDSATFHMKRCVMIQAFFMKHTCSFSDWKTAMWLITTRWSR